MTAVPLAIALMWFYLDIRRLWIWVTNGLYYRFFGVGVLFAIALIAALVRSIAGLGQMG